MHLIYYKVYDSVCYEIRICLMRSNIVPHYFPYRHFPIPFDSAEESEVGYGIDDGGHGVTP